MKTRILLALIAAGFLFTLSGLMGMGPGSTTSRDDAWFDADIATYEKFLAEPIRFRPSPLHPLILFVWRPMGRGLAMALGGAGMGEASGMVASRSVVAGFAALGFAGLWALATGLGVRVAPKVALTVVGLLATANLIACVPETYGISFGLLATTAAVVWSGSEPRRKAWILAALAVLCAGSTITNGVYPGVALLYLGLRTPESGGIRPAWLSARLIRRLAIVAGVAGLVVAGLAVVGMPTLGRKFPNLKSHLLGWLHFRIYFEPARTLRDWVMGLVYPVVGPFPVVRTGRVGYGANFGGTWTWAHLVGASAWSGLLASGLVSGLRDGETRSFVLGLAGWVAFNFAIHSVWGGTDNFLYSPHWSWALLAIALMAARGPRSWPVLGACLLIAPAQFLTLRHLASAVSGP